MIASHMKCVRQLSAVNYFSFCLDSNIVRFVGSETGEKRCFYVMVVIAVCV
jgi:hypothetical protein